MAEIAPLKIKVRPGAYARTADTLDQILNATLQVLMKEGYAAVTLRRVAAESGLRVGNLTYHFPTKNDLIKALLDAVLEGYQDRARRIMSGVQLDDRTRLQSALFLTLRDIQSFQTTYLFPELWSLANHDPEIEARLHDFYRAARQPLVRLLGRLNPRLSEEDAETLAVFMSSFMEGTTIFAGHGKPYAGRMADLVSLACQTFVGMAETATPERMRELRSEWETASPEIDSVPAFLLRRAHARAPSE